jgi:hypothetical protein
VATMKIDQAASFSLAILMSAQPKMAFSNGKRLDTQDTNKDGVPKWVVQVSVADREFGGADLLKITVTSAKNPAEAAQIGTPIHFENLGIGIMNGNPFFTATGIAPAGAPQNGRQKQDA